MISKSIMGEDTKNVLNSLLLDYPNKHLCPMEEGFPQHVPIAISYFYYLHKEEEQASI
jgi:hypothetical protein